MQYDKTIVVIEQSQESIKTAQSIIIIGKQSTKRLCGHITLLMLYDKPLIQ